MPPAALLVALTVLAFGPWQRPGPPRCYLPTTRDPRTRPGPMSDGTTVSVVLPVHQGVVPEVFREALDSVLDQTRPADEIVVVEDGPIPERLDAVLRAAASRHPGLATAPAGDEPRRRRGQSSGA